MDITLMFILAGFIIFLGFFGEIIFRRTKVPDALFLIIFGVIISQALHWIDPVRFNNIAAIFTTFALVFMGFEGAINLNISRIIKGLGKGTLLTFANFIISVSVVTVIGKISGFSLVNSVLLGVVLASISAEIVIPMLKSLGMREESVLSLTVESALGDVLCVLSALTIMKFINIGEFTWAAFGNNFLLYFIISVIIGIILGILWVFFLKLMENISRSYMITIACMVLLFGIVEYFGYDGAFSCLAFGLVLGNSEIFLKVLKKQDYTFKITPNQKFFFSQISFFMKTFFFVYLGMIMSFGDTKPILIGIMITIALFLARPIAVYLAFRKNTVSRDRGMMESLVPRGLSAAILAQVPILAGIKGTENFASITLTVIFLSILITTIMVFSIRHGWFKGFGKIYSVIGLVTGKKIKEIKKEHVREKTREKKSAEKEFEKKEKADWVDISELKK